MLCSKISILAKPQNLLAAVRQLSVVGSEAQEVARKEFNFQFSEEQQSYIDLASKFCKEEIIPNASKYDKSGEFPWEIVKKAHSLGLMNLNVPVKYGGAGLKLMDICIIAEQLSYGCSGIASAISSARLAQAPVLLFGTDEQKKEYLGRMTKECLLAAYCVTEPGTGSDVSGIKTSAVKNADGNWVINGQKMWITNGGVANWYFVLTRTDPNPNTPKSKAFTSFVVDANSPGVSHGRKEWNMGLRCSDTRGVTFEEVVVPKENLLGNEGEGFKVIYSSTSCICRKTILEMTHK